MVVGPTRVATTATSVAAEAAGVAIVVDSASRVTAATTVAIAAELREFAIVVGHQAGSLM